MASITKRGDSSWRLTIYSGKDLDGKYIRHTKTVKCKTKKLAEIELAKFQIEIETGLYISPQKMTLSSFISEWQHKYAVIELEKKTLHTYLRVIELRIIPSLGHLKLDEIKPIHIVTLLSTLQQKGTRLDGKDGYLSSGSIQYVYRVLKNTFSRAVDWKIIKSSPMIKLKQPKVTYKQSEVYCEDEVKTLFEKLKTVDVHWRMLVRLAVTTGLRRGELVCLEWKNVDLEQGVIHVRQSITLFENAKPIIKVPKTKKSIRKVTLSEAMLLEMKQYYQHCLDEWESLKETRDNEHFFVFFNQYGNAFYPETPYLWFRNFLKKHNLRYIKFHDLRHTSATLLINQGVHAKIISERLGHSDIGTTMNIYGHVLQEADREAARKFDNLLN